MPNSYISLNEYQTRHDDALTHFGNDILWAYTPVTFMTNGYASNIRSEAELIRFVDPMKEALSRQVDDSDKFIRQYSLRTRFTDDEAQLMLAVREKTAALTQRLFGRRITPLNSILSAMGLFRVISYIEKCLGGRKLRVLEVGPGSGYLGAFLIETGHEYSAVDTTQSFYLWQSRFFSHFCPSGFEEQALTPATETPQFGTVNHIPWWHFVSSIGHSPIKADIVICEQAISEMHAWASRFMAMTARNVLAESDVKLLLFSDFGHPTVSAAEIEGMLGEYQFSRVLSKLVYAFTPGQHSLPSDFYTLDSDLPLYGAHSESKLKAPSQFLKVNRSELPLDLEFRHFLRIWPHYDQFVIPD